MKVRARYTATTVGATSVTLTPKAGKEDEDGAGDPGVFGTGTIVVTQAVTPATGFWRAAATGVEYIVEVTRV